MQERFSRGKEGQLWQQREPLQLGNALLIRVTKRPRNSKNAYNKMRKDDAQDDVLIIRVIQKGYDNYKRQKVQANPSFPSLS